MARDIVDDKLIGKTGIYPHVKLFLVPSFVTTVSLSAYIPYITNSWGLCRVGNCQDNRRKRISCRDWK